MSSPSSVLVGALCIALGFQPALLAQASDPQVLATIRAQAERNDPDALFALSAVYEVGRDAPKDPARALELLQRAAQLNHAPSLTQLGLMHQAGAGLPKDPARAHQLFRRAAESNDPEGKYRLAMSLNYAIGTVRNPSEARRWMAAAANDGHQEAQLALAVMIQQGVGGAKNDFAARRWSRAAMNGPDKRVVAEAGKLVEQFDQRLLYSGMNTAEFVTGVVLALGLLALVADVGSTANFTGPPDHPFNPYDYGAFGTTRRRQNCRFVSRRTGMDITSGRGTYMYLSNNVWVCS